MGVICLSYRRDASTGYAGRLYDRLARRNGKRNVFMDVDAIPVGDDFVERLKKALATSDVLLALIGNDWAGKDRGSSRLEDANDFVRPELTTALECGVVFVPVVLPGASVPGIGALHDALTNLAVLNAFYLPANGFHQAVDRLIKCLDGTLASVAQNRRELAKDERKRLREQTRLPISKSAFRTTVGQSLQRLASLLAGSTRRCVPTFTAGAAIAILSYIANSFAHHIRLMNAKLSVPLAGSVTYAQLPRVLVDALEAIQGASFVYYSTAYALRPLQRREDCDRQSSLTLDLARVLFGAPSSSWLQKARVGNAAAYLISSL
jgi:TIR domain